jgi:UTP--glucose-1-phosphate uridylyltransferase
VRVARRAVGDEAFAVLLPDDVIRGPRGALAQMVDAHRDTGGHMLATMQVPLADTAKYGVLDITGQNGRLSPARGLVEKPRPEAAPSREAVVGRYILEPSVFERLADIGPGAGGELQLTDAINADAATVPVHGYRFEGARYDCGSQEGYVAATVAFALDRPELAQAVRQTAEAEAPALRRAA